MDSEIESGDSSSYSDDDLSDSPSDTDCEDMESSCESSGATDACTSDEEPSDSEDSLESDVMLIAEPMMVKTKQSVDFEHVVTI